VLAIDVLGAALSKAPTVAGDRAQAFAAYTEGYNHCLFAKRAHDQTKTVRSFCRISLQFI
jgi:hypothetical protein